MSIRIVTDSTCDLPPDLVANYGISVIPSYINIGNQSYLDGIEISREEFYRNLPSYKQHPTTASPSSEKFKETYEELARQGATEILSIHISENLSAILNIARLAAQEIKSVPVTVFDSRQLTLGMGFLVETAARLAVKGCSAGEILSALNSQVKRSYVFAALDTLEFLRRSGRMNGVVTGIGALLQIKPIMFMHDGKPASRRVRTHQRAMGRVLEMLEEICPLERVAIVHTHAADFVAELQERAAHLLPAGEILTVDITPVLGAHIGPGAAGFACISVR